MQSIPGFGKQVKESDELDEAGKYKKGDEFYNDNDIEGIIVSTKEIPGIGIEYRLKMTKGQNIGKQVWFSEKKLEELFKKKNLKESVEYKEFISKEAKSKGYDSIGEIPKDKLDDFYLEIDKKWNSKKEDGKDGANESFDILEANDKSSLIKRYTKNLEDVKKSYSTKDGLDSTRNDEYIAYAQAQLDAVKKDGLDGLLALWNKKK